MNRRILLAGIIALALAGVAWATGGFGLWRAHDAGLTLYGNVDVREVDLAFRVPGRIASMAVDEGDKVAAGAVLARLDPRPLGDALAQQSAQIGLAQADYTKRLRGNRAQEIAQARAAVGVPQAALARAQAEYARRQALVGSGAVSVQALEQARQDVGAARAQLAQAQAAYSLALAGSRSEDIAAAKAQQAAAIAGRDRAQTDLADAVLTAPEAGTVLTRAREPGAIVQGGENVYTLSIDRPLRIRAYVANGDLSRIAPGMAVEVTADGNGKTYHGTIGAIASAAEFTPKTVQTEDLRADLVYRVRIIVSDPDDALRQGQPVTVRIAAARAAQN